MYIPTKSIIDFTAFDEEDRWYVINTMFSRLKRLIQKDLDKFKLEINDSISYNVKGPPVFSVYPKQIIVDDKIELIKESVFRKINAQNTFIDLRNKIKKALHRRRHKHWKIELIYHEFFNITFVVKDRYCGLAALLTEWGE